MKKGLDNTKDPKDFRCASEQERLNLGEFTEKYSRHPPLQRHQVYVGKTYEYSGHEVELRAVVHDPYIGKPFGWIDDSVARSLKVVQLSELQVMLPSCAQKIVDLCTAPLLAHDLGRNGILHMVKQGGLRLFLEYHYELPEVELNVAVDHIYRSLRAQGVLSPVVPGGNKDEGGEHNNTEGEQSAERKAD